MKLADTLNELNEQALDEVVQLFSFVGNLQPQSSDQQQQKNDATAVASPLVVVVSLGGCEATINGGCSFGSYAMDNKQLQDNISSSSSDSSCGRSSGDSGAPKIKSSGSSSSNSNAATTTTASVMMPSGITSCNIKHIDDLVSILIYFARNIRFSEYASLHFVIDARSICTRPVSSLHEEKSVSSSCSGSASSNSPRPDPNFLTTLEIILSAIYGAFLILPDCLSKCQIVTSPSSIAVTSPTINSFRRRSNRFSEKLEQIDSSAASHLDTLDILGHQHTISLISKWLNFRRIFEQFSGLVDRCSTAFEQLLREGSAERPSPPLNVEEVERQIDAHGRNLRQVFDSPDFVNFVENVEGELEQLAATSDELAMLGLTDCANYMRSLLQRHRSAQQMVTRIVSHSKMRLQSLLETKQNLKLTKELVDEISWINSFATPQLTKLEADTDEVESIESFAVQVESHFQRCSRLVESVNGSSIGKLSPLAELLQSASKTVHDRLCRLQERLTVRIEFKRQFDSIENWTARTRSFVAGLTRSQLPSVQALEKLEKFKFEVGHADLFRESNAQVVMANLLNLAKQTGLEYSLEKQVDALNQRRVGALVAFKDFKRMLHERETLSSTSSSLLTLTATTTGQSDDSEDATTTASSDNVVSTSAVRYRGQSEASSSTLRNSSLSSVVSTNVKRRSLAVLNEITEHLLECERHVHVRANNLSTESVEETPTLGSVVKLRHNRRQVPPSRPIPARRRYSYDVVEDSSTISSNRSMPYARPSVASVLSVPAAATNQIIAADALTLTPFEERTIGELISTEHDYISSLRHVVTTYLIRLVGDTKPSALHGKLNIIFGNIESLLEFHENVLLPRLKLGRSNLYTLAQSFLRSEQELASLYVYYNTNKPRSDRLLLENATYFNAIQAEADPTNKLNLASYLLKPVQRLTKYVQFFRQLLAGRQQSTTMTTVTTINVSGDSTGVQLGLANRMLTWILRHGNDLLLLDNLRGYDFSLVEQGQLLLQGKLYVEPLGRPRRLRQVFLFEELLVITKIRRSWSAASSTSSSNRLEAPSEIYDYKESLKLCEIGLTAAVGKSGTKFQIWYRRPQSGLRYILKATSTENGDHSREVWTSEIQTLLWKQAVATKDKRTIQCASMGIGLRPLLNLAPPPTPATPSALTALGGNVLPSCRLELSTSTPYQRAAIAHAPRPYSLFMASAQ